MQVLRRTLDAAINFLHPDGLNYVHDADKIASFNKLVGITPEQWAKTTPEKTVIFKSENLDVSESTLRRIELIASFWTNKNPHAQTLIKIMEARNGDEP